ncbi:unannotated protein [freshwater metagenome]|uniref:Unannotated protein n=1 Tax=freshwater metagenome TaxID=449393 RepID=A0A6J6HHI5_9ZZZZ
MSQISASDASRGVPHSKPALRYIWSTGFEYTNPYVIPAVCENKCHISIGSVTGSYRGAVRVPERKTF